MSGFLMKLYLQIVILCRLKSMNNCFAELVVYEAVKEASVQQERNVTPQKEEMWSLAVTTERTLSQVRKETS